MQYDAAAATRVAQEKLGGIALPVLARPPVPEKASPTQELVYWAAKVYCFSLLASLREMLKSFLFLAGSGHVPASILVARCLFEMGAHTYYVHKHVTQYLDGGDINRAWEFLEEINMGSRYMKEEYGQAEEQQQFPASREIGKVIRCYDEWLGQPGRASTEYSFLSEFAHPNMAAFSHYYGMSSGESGFTVVTFHEPKRETERVPFDHVSLAVTSSLQFTLKILGRIGETEVASQINAVREALPH